MIPIDDLQACSIHDAPEYGLAWLDGEQLILGTLNGEPVAVDLFASPPEMVYRAARTGDVALIPEFAFEADPATLRKLRYLDDRVGALVYHEDKILIFVPGSCGRGAVPVQIGTTATPLSSEAHEPYAFTSWRIVTGKGRDTRAHLTWPATASQPD